MVIMQLSRIITMYLAMSSQKTLNHMRALYETTHVSGGGTADFKATRDIYYKPIVPELQEQLNCDGYVHIPAAVPKLIVDFFRKEFADIFKCKQTSEYVDQHKGIGSLFDMLEFPWAVGLAVDPWLLGLRNRLGFVDAKFTYGIVFIKAPHTPRTFWHQDGTVWNTDLAYEDPAPEILQAFYLDGSNENYGALRVLPGTHRRRHELHTILANTPKPDLRSAKDPTSPAFATQEGEVTIATEPGDMVLMDARLLHSTHANTTALNRTTVTLSYLSSKALADERVLARYTPEKAEANTRVPYIPEGFLPPDLRSAFASVLPPPYLGEKSPLPYCNTPRWVTQA